MWLPQAQPLPASYLQVLAPSRSSKNIRGCATTVPRDMLEELSHLFWPSAHAGTSCHIFTQQHTMPSLLCRANKTLQVCRARSAPSAEPLPATRLGSFTHACPSLPTYVCTKGCCTTRSAPCCAASARQRRTRRGIAALLACAGGAPTNGAVERSIAAALWMSFAAPL